MFGRRTGTVRPPEEESGSSGDSAKLVRPLKLLSAPVQAAPLKEALGVRRRWAPGICAAAGRPPLAPGLTCFVYPGTVPVQLTFNLLLAPQFHESPPVLHSLSLFGKFPVDKDRIH